MAAKPPTPALYERNKRAATSVPCPTCHAFTGEICRRLDRKPEHGGYWDAPKPCPERERYAEDEHHLWANRHQLRVWLYRHAHIFREPT